MYYEEDLIVKKMDKNKINKKKWIKKIEEWGLKKLIKKRKKLK